MNYGNYEDDIQHFYPNLEYVCYWHQGYIQLFYN